MSKDNETKQNGLAELRAEFNHPITVYIIKQGYIDYLDEIGKKMIEGTKVESNQIYLKDFLIDSTNKFFKAINLEGISKETLRIEGFIEEIRTNKKFIKFDVVFENGDYNDANRLLQDIYTKWNDVQLRKELCSDHTVLIKKAIMYLTSLKKIVSTFIQEEDNYSNIFKNQAELKRFIETVTVDIDSYIEVLKSQITELSAWIDHTLSPKINMLMRADSSLRLLSKYAEWDKNYNNGCGDTEQKGYGSRGGRSDGFNIEKV